MEYVEGLQEMKKALDNGGILKMKGLEIESFELLQGHVMSGLISLYDLCGTAEVIRGREFHLFFGKITGIYDKKGMICETYASTARAISGNGGVKPFRIYSNQVAACKMSLMDQGFRIFVHPEKGFGDAFEITLGKCERTLREVRKGHHLPGLLISGEFGPLFEGHFVEL